MSTSRPCPQRAIFATRVGAWEVERSRWTTGRFIAPSSLAGRPRPGRANELRVLGKDLRSQLGDESPAKEPGERAREASEPDEAHEAVWLLYLDDGC